MSSVPESQADVVFRMDLPHGRCVGVSIAQQKDAPEDAASAHAPVPEAERDLQASMPPARRASFAAGRRALRLALTDLGFPGDFPLLPLPPPRGGPALPAGALGSISHKRTLAVALAAHAPADGAAALGVDLEEIRPLRFDLGRRVLTPGERQLLAAVPATERERFVIERFSLKEAFYKAVNGWSGPHLSFQAVEVTEIRHDGAVVWTAPLLEELELLAEGRIFQPTNAFLLTTVIIKTAPRPGLVAEILPK